MAFALFVTAVVFNVAAIANNNLQDLKTGQLVDATPSKQQWALLVGVLAGAAVIPPVLELLNQAYGFAGAPGADPAKALAAPQAGLISALAQGVIQNNIDWSLIEKGAAIGGVLIVLDAVLKKATNGKAHLSPLAVGLGIYLPTSATLMVVVGALVGAWFDKRAERSAKPEAAKQLGVLLASGMIVGEGLVGVLIAAIVAFQVFPLALVGDDFATAATWIGGGVFVAVIFALYRWVESMERFARWNDLIAEPAPDESLIGLSAAYRYARVAAFAATGKLEEAKAEKARLDAIAAATPEGAPAGLNTAKDLIAVAALAASARIALAQGQHAQAWERQCDDAREGAALGVRRRYGADAALHVRRGASAGGGAVALRARHRPHCHATGAAT